MIKYDSYNELVYKIVAEGSSVLDVGCATGQLIKKLLSEKGCEVLGIDADVESVKRARSEGLDVRNLDLEKFDSKDINKTFDYIIFADVLEHLRDPERVIRTFLNLLKPQGKVIISIPNIAFILYRLDLLFGRFNYRPYGVMDESHLRFFTLNTAEKLLTGSGLTVNKMWGYNGNLRPVFRFLIPLGKLLPSIFATDLVFLLQRKYEQ